MRTSSCEHGRSFPAPSSAQPRSPPPAFGAGVVRSVPAPLVGPCCSTPIPLSREQGSGAPCERLGSFGKVPLARRPRGMCDGCEGSTPRPHRAVRFLFRFGKALRTPERPVGPPRAVREPSQPRGAQPSQPRGTQPSQPCTPPGGPAEPETVRAARTPRPAAGPVRCQRRGRPEVMGPPLGSQRAHGGCASLRSLPTVAVVTEHRGHSRPSRSCRRRRRAVRSVTSPHKTPPTGAARSTARRQITNARYARTRRLPAPPIHVASREHPDNGKGERNVGRTHRSGDEWGRSLVAQDAATSDSRPSDVCCSDRSFLRQPN